MRRLVLIGAALAALLVLAAPAALAAPGWLPAQALSGPPAYGLLPQVAMDPAGDSVAVWESDETGVDRIVASWRPAGGSWSAPAALRSAPSGVSIYAVDVVIAATGEATAAWEVQDGGPSFLEAASMSPNGSWGEPKTFSTPGRPADFPDLAVDSAGNLTAAWHEFDGARYVVEAATRPPGGAWTLPQQLSSMAGTAQDPSVAVDDQGDAVVAWTSILQISGVTRSSGGAWSAPIELTPSGEIVRPPVAAMSPSGEAVVVWSRYEGSHYVAQSRSMSPSGVWSAKTNLSDGSSDVSEAEVGLDSAGEAIAIWEHPTGVGTALIEGATRPAGSAWGAAVGLTPAGHVASSPTLAVGSGGQAVLAWEGGLTLEAMTPYAVVRPAGDAWGAPQGLAPLGKLGNYPTVATDAGGDAVTAWESYGDGSSDVVEAAGFDGQGPQLSALTIPTSGQVGAPLSFSVKATDVWSPVAETSWQFDDGPTAAGDAVTHAFGKAGDFPVSVRVVDALGNATTADGGPVAVAAASGGAPQGLARARHVALVRRGRAALELRCGGGECAGVAKLYAPPPRRGRRRHRRPVLAGEGSFRIAPGASEVVKVKVSRNVLARLRRTPTLRFGTTLRGTDIAPGKVTLHEAKRKHVRRHR